jgi:hypothetical protein
MRRMAAAVAIAVAVLALAGCGSQPYPWQDVTQLAAGEIGDGTWSAVVYTSAEEGTCIQVRFSAGSPQGVCKGTSDGLGTFVADAPAGAGVVVVTEVRSGTMTDGEVMLLDGTTVAATIGEGDGQGRYAIGAVPEPGVPASMNLHATDGSTTVTIPLR